MADEKLGPLGAYDVGEPKKHDFPEMPLEKIRSGGQTFTVVLNNDVPGLIITGVEFTALMIGPQDVYSKRFREDGLHCEVNHYIEPTFRTPTSEDCPGAITHLRILFREAKPSGGGIGVKDQSSGKPGYCYYIHYFFLSNSLF